MILIVCAVRDELRALCSRDGVEVLAAGVGPVEAAAATARAVAARQYRLVVNAGIGGGFRDQARVGDAVAVDVERYAELAREDGDPLVLPGGIALENEARSDASLINAYRGAIAHAVVGRGVTSATITTSDARAAELARDYEPAVESMEGFAVLRAAALAGVPALEIRGISNIVGDRATSGWDFRAGASAVVGALEAFLEAVKAHA